MGWFTPQEFQCKCGKCPVRTPSSLLVERLEELRGRYGAPIQISSGWRCVDHNRSVGGTSTSAHLVGKAADLICTNSIHRYKLIEYILPLFDRIGIDKQFIHVDVDETKPQQVIWLY